MGVQIQLGNTKLARFDTRDHGVCARAEPDRHGTNRCEGNLRRRERVCERDQNGAQSH